MHFNHNKDFIWKSRGFNSVEEMNKTIIENWNDIVSKEDTVYLLGDIMLGDTELGIPLLKKLNGDIIIILGNHDTPSRVKKYKEEGYEVKYADLIIYHKKKYFLSHYPTITTNDGENIYNLYGHTHQLNAYNPALPFAYNVGVDAHSMYPISFDQIEQDLFNYRFHNQEVETI